MVETFLVGDIISRAVDYQDVQLEEAVAIIVVNEVELMCCCGPMGWFDHASTRAPAASW
jgi:hypothetical protein